MISDFSTMITQAILPGSRVPRFNGWDEFVKFNIPRDSELIGIDAALADKVQLQAQISNCNQTQTILGQMGRWVGWAGSGSQAAAVAAG